MNLSNSFDRMEATVVGFGVNTLLVSAAKDQTPLAHKLQALGCRLESCDEIYFALDRILDGPQDFELIVIDCDSLGGLAHSRRLHALLRAAGRCIPVILVSRECDAQHFPFNRFDPTELRAPLSAISLRVGFEHAMQERLLMARAS
jgi:hypothetical protein